MKGRFVFDALCIYNVGQEYAIICYIKCHFTNTVNVYLRLHIMTFSHLMNCNLFQGQN